MIGNDVIDLADPETAPGSVHARFDERVFAPDERRLLDASPDPTRTRWRLWAAKEAALKAARRLDPGATFAPRRFVVDPAAGRVDAAGRWLALRVDDDGGRVHALAFDPGLDPAAILWRARPLAPGEEPGRGARELARASVAAALGTDAGALDVLDGPGGPVLRRGGATLELSLSHHGRFVAFACRLRG